MAAELDWSQWLSMIAWFAVVIVLLLITLLMLKKIGPKISISGHRRLKILEVQNLGARQKLLLLSVNGEQILMGISPQGITRLGNWSMQEITADSEQITDRASEGKLDHFKRLLSEVAKR